MQKRKVIMTLAVVSALGLSGQAFANHDDPVPVQTTDVEVQADVDLASHNTISNDTNTTLNDSSKNLNVGPVLIDKSEDESVTKTNSANDGSAATLNGDAAKQEAEQGAVAAIGGDAKNEETDAYIDGVEGGSVAATTGATASMSNSNNVDQSINTKAEEGSVAVNSGGNAVVSTTEDSLNNKAQDHSAAIYGSGTATVNENVGNTTNSDNTTTTLTVGDIDVEIASSELDGTVSGNVQPATTLTELPLTGNNTLDGELEATGITVISQNTGYSSLVQQSVNVQVNRQ
ncbi:hypothetical protein [Geotalea sp. SG265]|uniref:hypothetical protein n=1 Tax=Geotalea sp. SG265 TaxID=2922867 RepID=UPI001FAEBB40|nr:hypothetical protein [Geotalea sp. SG265]